MIGPNYIYIIFNNNNYVQFITESIKENNMQSGESKGPKVFCKYWG